MGNVSDVGFNQVNARKTTRQLCRDIDDNGDDGDTDEDGKSEHGKRR